MEGSTAIVLAGGFGTRLKSVIDGIPKPMAEINGKPFLHYLLFQLTKFQIKNVILSVGYLHESILNYFDNKFFDLNIYYSVESKPLGTGGAIDKATTDFNLNEPVLILNGDSFFDINIDELFIFHK